MNKRVMWIVILLALIGMLAVTTSAGADDGAPENVLFTFLTDGRVCVHDYRDGYPYTTCYCPCEDECNSQDVVYSDPEPLEDRLKDYNALETAEERAVFLLNETKCGEEAETYYRELKGEYLYPFVVFYNDKDSELTPVFSLTGQCWLYLR